MALYPPAPPTSPRQRHTVRVIGVIVAILLVIGVVTVGAVLAINRFAPVRPALVAQPTPTQQPTPSPSLQPFIGDLRTLLLPVPAGAGTGTVPAFNADGTITIEQESMDAYGDKSHVDHLKGYGYLQGAYVKWGYSATHVSAFVKLLQFRPAVFATEYLDDWDKAESVDFTAAAELPGAPNGWCNMSKKPDGARDYYVICRAARNDIYVELWYFTPTAPDAADAEALTVRQFALLP
jgi:hypothetical protein